MRYRFPTAPLFVPLLMLASAAPASAQFDLGAVFQRAQMIANQVTQIANQVRQVRAMTRQLSELEDQLDHMERAARGELDALIEPFSELVADPSCSSGTDSPGVPTSPVRPARWSMPSGTWAAAAPSPPFGEAPGARPTG